MGGEHEALGGLCFFFLRNGKGIKEAGESTDVNRVASSPFLVSPVVSTYFTLYFAPNSC